MIVALAVLAMLACLPPPTNSIELSVAPAVFGEREVAVREAIRPGACPALINEEAAAFFKGRMLVRLPMGMDANVLVKPRPNFVRNVTLLEVVNCRDPEAFSFDIEMMMYEEVPAPDRPIEHIRDRLLAELGYLRDSLLVEVEAGSGIWVYDMRRHSLEGAPFRRKLLVAMQASPNATFGLVFEIHPSGWPIVADSMVASGRSLRVQPP